MGVNFKDLVLKKEISIPMLSGKRLVVDGNNILYQFLATIRQPDGSPLKDSHGNITSHLNGLFHRTTKLMHYGIKLIFVFDGKAPDLKRAERERRAGLKKEAQAKYESAKQAGDVDDMKKYSMRTSRLTREMIDEAKELLDVLGVPVVQAPSEGEAQAAFMVRNGDAFAEISQDYDCLLFGVPRMIQNLTISERKKMRDRVSYGTVKPQLLEFRPNLEHLGLTHDQLIALGMLIGTDFNVGGIKGIGPKKAMSLIKEHGDDLDSLFSAAGWAEHFPFSWKEVFNLFKEMPVEKEYSLEWKQPDREKIIKLLCDDHDFSRVRVEDAIDKMESAQSKMSQKGLGDFF